jgi:hypothetical protein
VTLPLLLDVLRVFLAITLAFYLLVIGVVVLLRWNLAAEERRYRRLTREARLEAELQAAERRRADEVRVIGGPLRSESRVLGERRAR